MSERKSINKYYPPDYDPKNEPKKKRKKTGSAPNVRLMLPFSIKCLHCDEYMAHRRKFNARKETTGEDYVGIKIIKFTFRCSRCYSQLSFKTDPRNGDFECVEGCKKNYEKPKAVKGNETIDEMIERLEKDALEDAKLKDKGSKKHQVTGVEELEQRMIQQQKQREMNDAIELLQEESTKFEASKGSVMDKLNLEELNEKDDSNQALDAFKQINDTSATSAKEEAMFASLVKAQEKKQNDTKTDGLSLGYSSSDEE